MRDYMLTLESHSKVQRTDIPYLYFKEVEDIM